MFREQEDALLLTLVLQVHFLPRPYNADSEIRVEYPTLAGNLAAIMIGLIVTVSVSLAKPEPFNWDTTRLINAPSLTATPSSGSIDKEKNEKDHPNSKSDFPTVRDEEQQMREDELAVEEPRKLRRAFKVACIASFLLTFSMDFLIRTLYFPSPFFQIRIVFGVARHVAGERKLPGHVLRLLSDPRRDLLTRKSSSDTHVPLPLHLLAGVLHRLGGRHVRLGLLLHGHLRHPSDLGDGGVL